MSRRWLAWRLALSMVGAPGQATRKVVAITTGIALAVVAAGLAGVITIAGLALTISSAAAQSSGTKSATERATPRSEARASTAAPPAETPDAITIDEAIIQQRRVILRFMTTADFPPFNVLDDEGNLSGFNVDLARAICIELGRTCEIEARPWGELLDALDRRETDAVIAGHAITAQNARRADFTDRYLFMVGRFATRRASGLTGTPEGLDGKRIGVAKATSHEAYARAFFPDSRLVAFDSPEQAREALANGNVDAIFDDGLGLSFWVGGTLSAGCCELLAGSYFDARYFGPGLAIAIGRGDRQMRALLNEGIARVRASGRLEELLQRYLPVRPY